MNTKEEILVKTVPILAREGYAGTSMRKVANAIGREPSVIYVHYADKETLLRAVRKYVNVYLDGAQHYTEGANTARLLRETLRFQIEHREMIVALLQYFMAARQDFPAASDGQAGYVPERAYDHMARVIRKGLEEGVYQSEDIAFDAKLTTHLVNGYLMEYFDRTMSSEEIARLVEQLAVFIERALEKRGGHS